MNSASLKSATNYHNFNTDYLKDQHFGEYGGRYVPELLIPALEQLEKVYLEAKQDPEFVKQLDDLLTHFAGRPTPLTLAKNLTRKLGGAKIYLKNEGLVHTGAHKINNALGQALLTMRMGKKKVLAETGAGQHGLASATASAKLGLDCKVFMGAKDIKRQYPNVVNMNLLGTEVISVEEGTKTLKDAVNMALKYWIENLDHYHYILGSALGPYPFPLMVRDFQSVIGREVIKQIMETENRLPDTILACVGGGSNSLGIFHPFLKENVRLIGVEAGGIGDHAGEHAARFIDPQVGIVQGYKSYFIQNSDGQLSKTQSISAGLDYAGIAPELAYLYDQGRVNFTSTTDKEVIKAFKLMAEYEGIFPALESSHAVAAALKIAPQMGKEQILVINISGQGNKDIFITSKQIYPEKWNEFLKNEIR